MFYDLAYGYNRNTKDESYRSPYYIVSSLVDIVSKNGNYLLNIGPDGDGVVPPAVVKRLEAVGFWLKQAGECIFGTVCIDFLFRNPRGRG
jgi:alpha-L-fucosidase